MIVYRRICKLLISLCALTWACSVAGAQTVTRGPYLQICTSNSIVIRWRTNTETNSRVIYGANVGANIWQKDDTNLVSDHEVALTGLQSNTVYYYNVGTTTQVLAGGDENHRFRTAPSPGSLNAVRVWVIGDSGAANQDARNVRDAYLSYPGSGETDVWLMLGDNAYEYGLDSEYQAGVFDMYPQLLVNTPLWPTHGNHDFTFIPGIQNYYDFFSLPRFGEAGGVASGTEAYYSYDYANVHFICLDSEGSDLSPGSSMLNWLAQDLAATNQQWTIAYWHHSPYSKGSHDSDSFFDSFGKPTFMRTNVLPVLEAGGVDLVLTGHSHSYERSFMVDGHYGLSSSFNSSMIIDDGDGRLSGDGAYLKVNEMAAPNEGTVYTVVGVSSKSSGGSLDHPVMVTSQRTLGSLILDINADVLNARFINDTGTELDNFTIIKGMTPTGIGDEAMQTPRLLTSAPNPFSQETTIRFLLPSGGEVQLAVYDVAGRLVRLLASDTRSPGDYVERWDGRNTAGQRVSSGVYFYRLTTGGFKATRRMVLLN